MIQFVRTTFVVCLVSFVLMMLAVAPAGAQDFATNTPLATATSAPQDVIAPVDSVVEMPTPADVTAALETPQDATEAGASIVETVVQFLHKFIIENPVFSVLTALVVGLLKFVPGIKPNAKGEGGISSQALVFIVAALLWLSYTAASLAGYQAQYDSWANKIAEFAPYVLGFFSTLLGASYVHEQSAKRNVAVLGAKRGDGVGQVNSPFSALDDMVVSISTSNSGATDKWEPPGQIDKAA